MDPHRTQRVSETFREELAELISFEMEDPRLAGVDVTGVEVSPDLRHAEVRIALHGEEADQGRALQALDHAKHFLRRELASRMNLRRMPELHFVADPASDAEARVDTLLRRAKKTRGKS